MALNSSKVEEGILGFPCFHLYESDDELPRPAQLGKH